MANYDVNSHNCGYCLHKNDTDICFAYCKRCTSQSCFSPEHVCESCVHNGGTDHADVVACNICRVALKDLAYPDNYEHVPSRRISFSEACKLMGVKEVA